MSFEVRLIALRAKTFNLKNKHNLNIRQAVKKQQIKSLMHPSQIFQFYFISLTEVLKCLHLIHNNSFKLFRPQFVDSNQQYYSLVARKNLHEYTQHTFCTTSYLKPRVTCTKKTVGLVKCNTVKL